MSTTQYEIHLTEHEISLLLRLLMEEREVNDGFDVQFLCRFFDALYYHAQETNRKEKHNG